MQMNFNFISSMKDAFLFQDEIQRTRVVNEIQSKDLKKEISKMCDVHNMLTEQMKNAVLPEEKQDYNERIERCNKTIQDMRKRRDACIHAVTECRAMLLELYCFTDSYFGNEAAQEVTA